MKETAEEMWCGAHILAEAHRTDKKKQADKSCEDKRLWIQVLLGISMVCGCLDVMITKMNHRLKRQRYCFR